MLPRCFQDASKMLPSYSKPQDIMRSSRKRLPICRRASRFRSRFLASDPVPCLYQWDPTSFKGLRHHWVLHWYELVWAGRIQMNSETLALDYLDFHLEIMMDHDGPCIKWDSRALMIFCSTTSPRISESVLCIKLLHSMYWFNSIEIHFYIRMHSADP